MSYSFVHDLKVSSSRPHRIDLRRFADTQLATDGYRRAGLRLACCSSKIKMRTP